MNDDGDIETMYPRFQTLVSGLQVIKKSYNVPDHVKKILRCLPARFRPNVPLPYMRQKLFRCEFSLKHHK